MTDNLQALLISAQCNWRVERHSPAYCGAMLANGLNLVRIISGFGTTPLNNLSQSYSELHLLCCTHRFHEAPPSWSLSSLRSSVSASKRSKTRPLSKLCVYHSMAGWPKWTIRGTSWPLMMSLLRPTNTAESSLPHIWRYAALLKIWWMRAGRNQRRRDLELVIFKSSRYFS